MAEVSVDKRIAEAKRLVKSGKYRVVGELQSAIKRQFGKGIPPARLGEVFGTKGRKKRTGRRKKTTRVAATRARQPRQAARTVIRTSGAGFPIEVSADQDLNRWSDLVAYLNENTTGRTKFSIRLDGESASLVAE